VKYIEKVIQTCGTHTLIVRVILYTICDKTSVSYLDLHLEIGNGGRLKTKFYDKHLGFTFPIVNSPFSRSNSLASQRMEFAFHNSYVILELVASTVIYWTELSC
jgi:hypothetical protein